MWLYLSFAICEQWWQLRFANNIQVILIYIPVRSAGDILHSPFYIFYIFNSTFDLRPLTPVH